MTAATRSTSPLAVRDFRLFWLGEAVSTLGDQFAMIALPWLALVITGDAFALGTVLALMALPRALFMIIGGAYVDRLSPRLVMLGSNVVRLRWWAWTLSGFLMGMGGGLWAQYNIAFGPRQFFFSITFSLLAMLVVGGLGSVSGAVIGAFVVTAVFEIMRRIEDRIDVPGITQIVVALVILLVLYRRPNGLMGLSEADDVLSRSLRRLRGRGSPAPRG